MAVSQIEEKILGRLSRQTSFPTRTRTGNEALSASFFQVLGLSILLSKKLVKARRLRKLDNTRDTKSLKLYHHIIWLAREGLAITEAYILPYCQNGESGPECRVMAAKLRASFCHVFCLFHNYPPVSQLSAKSGSSSSPPSTVLSPKADNGQSRKSPAKSPKPGKENGNGGRRSRKKGALRDPIPSMNSDTSYVTNPYAVGPAQTPPPAGPPPPLPPEARRTPTRPPGLTPIDIPASQAAASFLLPPMNWVPLTVEHFGTAQRLAESSLPPAHALRLSIALEHAAFLWDCEKNHQRSRHIARKAIKDVYASTEGLDDDEFLDASSLVQALGGIVRRGSNESTPRPSQEQVMSPPQTTSHAPPPIDRTIAVSPTKNKGNRNAQNQSPAQIRSILKTPERLSTVPEVNSTEAISEAPSQAQTVHAMSPPVSRLSSRSTRSRPSDKAAKRRAVEQAEARSLSRQGSQSQSSGTNSRQPTPQEGLSTSSQRKPSSSSRTSPMKMDAVSTEEGAVSSESTGKTSPDGSESSSGGIGNASLKTVLPVGMDVPKRKPVPATTDLSPPEPVPPPRTRVAERQEPARTEPERGSIPIVRDFAVPTAPAPPSTDRVQPLSSLSRSDTRNSDPQTHARERREAILSALAIISSVQKGLQVPDQQRRQRYDSVGRRIRAV